MTSTPANLCGKHTRLRLTLGSPKIIPKPFLPTAVWKVENLFFFVISVLLPVQFRCHFCLAKFLRELWTNSYQSITNINRAWVAQDSLSLDIGWPATSIVQTTILILDKDKTFAIIEWTKIKQSWSPSDQQCFINYWSRAFKRPMLPIGWWFQLISTCQMPNIGY